MKNKLAGGILAMLMIFGAIALLESQERINQPNGPMSPPPLTIRGVGVLTDGTAQITLDPDFEAATEADCRSVQLTCKSTGSILWASEVRQGQFTVSTDAKGNRSQQFWWEVTAPRKHGAR